MMFTYCALQRELLSASVTELLGAKTVRVPDSGVRRAGDDDPLIILQTQHRARVTSQYLQTLQRLLIPDLWWKGGQVGKKGKTQTNHMVRQTYLQRGRRTDRHVAE